MSFSNGRSTSYHATILESPDTTVLEQNKEAHAELLSNYQAILEENFNRWCEFSTKKSNALINSSISNTQLTRDQFLESCIQLIDEKIKSREGQEIYDLTRISRQAAIINLLSAFLVLVSVVLVFVILS